MIAASAVRVMSDDNAPILLALGRVEGTLALLTSAVSRGHSRIDEVDKRLNAVETHMIDDGETRMRNVEIEAGKVGLKVYLLCAGVALVATAITHFGAEVLKDRVAPVAKAATYQESGM